MSNSEEFIRSRETLSPQLPLQDHSHKSISHHHLSLSFVLIDKVFLCIHTLCLPTGCTWFFCTKWNRLPEASAQIWNRKLKGYRLWSLQHTVLKEVAMYVHVHYWKPIRGGKQGRNLALERPPPAGHWGGRIWRKSSRRKMQKQLIPFENGRNYISKATWITWNEIWQVLLSFGRKAHTWVSSNIKKMSHPISRLQSNVKRDTYATAYCKGIQ